VSRDIIARQGVLAMASRLKRLSERMYKDMSRVYAAIDVGFEARWFPVFHALGLRSPRSVVELARELGLTHPAVTQIAQPLVRQGLLREASDPKDARRRMLNLTPAGRRLHDRLRPIWAAVARQGEEMLQSAGVDLLGTLARLESALDERSMYERLRPVLGLPRAEPLRIVSYCPSYKKHFRRLNEEWLKTYFNVEPGDEQVMRDPNGRIVRRGGFLFFAVLGEKVVGTCALRRERGDVYELAHMAVTPTCQGQGIGRALAEAAIEQARLLGVDRLYLQTHPILKRAGRLYRDLGFRRITRHPLPTGSRRERGGYVMVLKLMP
jgi:GNAT superfamily N-acetyltransferase/DNA-binding MarR family transcriptional regulator